TARARVRRLLLWGVPALAGPVIVAVVNRALYGSPLSTGYGDLSGLYSWRFVAPNILRYSSWLWTYQTGYLLLALLAVPLLRRHGHAARAWTAAWGLAFAAVVLLSYLFYLPFEDWTFLRFFLPAYPMLLALA